MIRMTEVFKEAYNKSDRSVREEVAMEWFFAGIAAQKAIAPPVRMADAEEFAAMRRARYGEKNKYRSDIVATTREGQIFLDIMRLLNHDHGAMIPITSGQVDQASELLAIMQGDGAKFHQLTASNFAKNHDTPYRMYSGYNAFRKLLDDIVQNHILATKGSAS